MYVLPCELCAEYGTQDIKSLQNGNASLGPFPCKVILLTLRTGRILYAQNTVPVLGLIGRDWPLAARALLEKRRLTMRRTRATAPPCGPRPPPEGFEDRDTGTSGVGLV